MEPLTMKMIDLGQPMVLSKNISGERTNLGWVINNFDLWLTINKYTINTTLTYIKCVKGLLSETSFQNPTLSSKDIETFLTGRTNTYFSATKIFLKFAYSTFNKKFIHIEYPRIFVPEKKIVQVLSSKQINLIIMTIQEDLRFFTKFLYNFALRISEMYRLKVNSIDWDTWMDDKSKYGLLTIKKTKGKKERQLPVNPKFMLEIFDYINNRDGKVMQDRLLFDYKSEKYFNRRLRKMKKFGVGNILELSEKDIFKYREDIVWHKFITKNTRNFEIIFNKASLKALGKSSYPHILRASKLTELLDSGVPLINVRDFAGHVSVVTTERYLRTNVQQLIVHISRIESEKENKEK